MPLYTEMILETPAADVGFPPCMCIICGTLAV
jgi:hypothetical protein